MASSDEDSGSDDSVFGNFDNFKKLERKGGPFPGGTRITTVEDLRARDRSKILVLPPEDDEELLEDTDDVPSEEEALKIPGGFWSIRIRTDLPEEYHHMRPVIVSEIMTENCYIIFNLECIFVILCFHIFQ